jgi:hypothetical protein
MILSCGNVLGYPFNQVQFGDGGVRRPKDHIDTSL